ncbi:MAG: hypothetical protein OEM82_16355, partial [Acidobacteriota bacterium]|nr:hypothetical protein [Acidobacteriota bacterium]
MKLLTTLITAISVTAILVLHPAAFGQTGTANLITAKSVGEITIGSTVADVKKVIAGATFSRGSGEGVDEIEVKQNGETIFWLVAEAGDENYEAPVDGKTEIIGIHVFDKKYKTMDGIGVGTTIADAEKQYGKLSQIWVEGLTGDEYATFSDHPEGIDFRVSKSLDNDDPEDRAGVYEADKDTTAEYVEGAVISTVRIPGFYGRDFVSGGDASKSFLLSNASQAFKIKIDINGCDKEICEGPAMVQIFRKNEDLPFQTA